MHLLKLLTLSLVLSFGFFAMAQVQIDHPILLTGSGVNAKLSGIQSVTGSQDATSVQSIQNGSFIYGITTGSGNAFNLSISPVIGGYQAGMVFYFISNQTNTGASTLNVNSYGAVPVVKNVNQAFTGCEIQTGQAVSVLYDGTNFQMLSVTSTGGLPAADAGPGQINVSGTSTYLAGNTPSSGSGAWHIVSGTGGNIVDSTNPNSLFTGLAGNSYVLSWTVTNTCGSASSNVNISFGQQPHGSQTFSSPSTNNPFTVPANVTSITIECYGAQGASNGYASGGNGGYAKGNLVVSPGLTLYASIGGQNGTNGGGSGGSSNSGGGMSDVRRESTSFDSVLIVAGGGGAAAGVTNQYGGTPGGAGGGAAVGCANGGPGAGGPGRGVPYSYNGNDGTCTTGGANGADQAGTGNSGGAGGGGLTSGGLGSDGGGYGSSGTNGSFGQGGNYGYNSSCSTSGGPGAGGGGGYYGGGGTASSYCGAGGAGGGSSWASTELTSLTFTGGVQSGNGQVVITW